MKLFKDNSIDVNVLPRSGRPGNAIAPCSEQNVDVLSTEDQRMMTRETVVSLGILYTPMQGDRDFGKMRSLFLLDFPVADRWAQ
jgi:hypothetical protein